MPDASVVQKVVDALLEADAYIATKYISPNFVIRATRTLFNRKIDRRGNIYITLTIGRPNYKERDFIKLCKKAKESFPVQKIQLRFPPKKKS